MISESEYVHQNKTEHKTTNQRIAHKLRKQRLNEECDELKPINNLYACFAVLVLRFSSRDYCFSIDFCNKTQIFVSLFLLFVCFIYGSYARACVCSINGTIYHTSAPFRFSIVCFPLLLFLFKCKYKCCAQHFTYHWMTNEGPFARIFFFRTIISSLYQLSVNGARTVFSRSLLLRFRHCK